MNAPRRLLRNVWRKSKVRTAKGCCALFWTNPGSNTLQNSSCMATYLPSHKRKVRRSRYVGNWWRSKAVFLPIPLHGRAGIDRPAKIYIHQLCVDIGCILEDLPGAMENTEGWRERETERDRDRERENKGTSTWWRYIYIYRERDIYREREYIYREYTQYIQYIYIENTQ